jgi:hypothetical protein
MDRPDIDVTPDSLEELIRVLEPRLEAGVGLRDAAATADRIEISPALLIVEHDDFPVDVVDDLVERIKNVIAFGHGVFRSDCPFDATPAYAYCFAACDLNTASKLFEPALALVIESFGRARVEMSRQSQS